jgi:hypothetical protein
MKRADFLFVLVISLIILALILVIVNIHTLFPTPEPQAFVNSLAPAQ